MCSKPSVPKYEPPAASPPPPPDPIQINPATANTGSQGEAEARRKGRNALRIDLQTGTSGGTGVNIPKG